MSCKNRKRHEHQGTGRVNMASRLQVPNIIVVCLIWYTTTGKRFISPSHAIFNRLVSDNTSNYNNYVEYNQSFIYVTLTLNGCNIKYSKNTITFSRPLFSRSSNSLSAKFQTESRLCTLNCPLSIALTMPEAYLYLIY